MAIPPKGIDYRPLNPSKKEIRLLRLHPEDEDHKSPIHTSLIKVSLSDDPFYHALSYCWGDASSRDLVVVDGKPVSVTANLATGLRELRRREVRTLWANAICINQGDEGEKGHQVAYMGNVYSRASGVFAWPGPKLGDSDLIMNEIESYSYTNIDNDQDSTIVQLDDGRGNDLENAFANLLERQYWRHA